MKKFIFTLIITIVFSNNIERLEYAVFFNEIKAGNASLTLAEDATGLNYIINFELKSNKFLDVVYKLRENTSMIVNKKDFSIYEIQKSTRQGRRKKSYNANFDYKTKVGTIDIKGEKTFLSFNNPVYDSINLIYYLRNNLDSLDYNYSFDIISKKNFKNIFMKKISEEKMTFNDEVHQCIVIGPDGSNELKNTDYIKIWFTKDNIKLPIIIEKRAKLGIIKMELISSEIYD